MTIPVGKDSLSMSTEWTKDNQKKSVNSPLSLIVSGFSPVKDIHIAVTPELKNKADSSLLFIDLAKGKQRMGGSILAQINNEVGGESPDVECVKEMPSFVHSIHTLLSLKKILAYHDRSDGGLITTLSEMSFAGRLGLNINLNSLITDESEIVDLLFNEELGVVIQVLSKDLDFVYETLNSTDLKGHIYNIGPITEKKQININLHDQYLYYLAILRMYLLTDLIHQYEVNINVYSKVDGMDHC